MSDDSGSDGFHHVNEDITKYHTTHPGGDDGYDVGGPQYASGSRPRSSRGADSDVYEPSNYGARSYAARDGYTRDAMSDNYQRSSSGGRDRGSREYGAPVPIYKGADRRRSYDDNDVDDYEERNRVQKYRKDSERGSDRPRSSHSQRPSSRKSRGSDSDGEEHGDGNDPLKKWGATVVGAAVGGLAAHKMKGSKGKAEENWVAAGIGAVIGGLVAREAEKQYVKRKDHHREEEERY